MAAVPRCGGADEGCVVVNELRVVCFDDNVRMLPSRRETRVNRSVTSVF